MGTEEKTMCSHVRHMHQLPSPWTDEEDNFSRVAPRVLSWKATLRGVPAVKEQLERRKTSCALSLAVVNGGSLNLQVACFLSVLGVKPAKLLGLLVTGIRCRSSFRGTEHEINHARFTCSVIVARVRDVCESRECTLTANGQKGNVLRGTTADVSMQPTWDVLPHQSRSLLFSTARYLICLWFI
ncbi:unnamed protein product [Musa acuminata subsp. burmannicoides]